MVGACSSFARLAIIVGVITLAACQETSTVPTTIPIAAASEFIGRSLPTDAARTMAAGDSGLDRLVLMRFDASPIDATTFVTGLLGADATPGRDPGLGYLGAGLDWWPATPPAGSAGGETRTATNRTIKLLVVPGPADRRTVYVAAFSQ